MSLEDNNGTQYYEVPIGVPSDVGVVLSANNGTGYYHQSAFDYILWGQGTHYTSVTANSGTQYYFYECNVPSSSSLNLESNSGTAYYYSSAFNCVPWV